MFNHLCVVTPICDLTYRISMKKTIVIRTNSMPGNYFNKAMQELEEVIQNMYNGEKLKW